MALFTFEDMVEHILTMFEDDRTSPRSYAVAKRAILESYRDLSNLHSWNYYHKRHIFSSEASYSTGTVEYTDSTRIVTLTGGTFPANADKFNIVFTVNPYQHSSWPILSRDSDTQLTLKSGQTPGADLAAGSSYQLFRQQYDLPADFRELGRLIDLDNQYELRMVDTDIDELTGVFVYDSPDTPWQFSLRSSNSTPGRLAIHLTPPPSGVRTYQFMYFRAPRTLRIDREREGTIAVSAGSDAVTGTSTDFNDNMVGGVMRIGTTTKYPSADIGYEEDNTASYIEEHVIKSVTDATNLTLETDVAAVGTDVLYSISNMIDIEPGAMTTALMRWAEAVYTRMTKRYLEQRTARDRDARIALNLAKEYDLRSTVETSPGYYNPFRRTIITTDPG